MILFIYPFGRRIRKAAPRAHTLAEVVHARHGRSSRLMLAGSNVVGSVIAVMSNVIAGGALISMLSPFGHVESVLCIAAGVLLYTLWSGFRASVLTDLARVVALLGAVVLILPALFFSLGGPSLFAGDAQNLTPQQADFFSWEAFLDQGAPYIAAVLAYAIGNQTIAQRLFAVREDLIRPTFVTGTVGYGATIIGIGMICVLPLYAGIEPAGATPTTSSRRSPRAACRACSSPCSSSWSSARSALPPTPTSPRCPPSPWRTSTNRGCAGRAARPTPGRCCLPAG